MLPPFAASTLALRFGANQAYPPIMYDSAPDVFAVEIVTVPGVSSTCQLDIGSGLLLTTVTLAE